MASAAWAQDPIDQSYPYLGGNVITRLGYNGDYKADTPRVEANDVFLQVIASPVFHLSDRFRLNTELRVETVVPPTDDRAFEDQGLFARFLQLEYNVTERLSVHAGKMTPSFALGSLVTPGMFGNSYSKEIELIDRIGLGGSYRFGGDVQGQHTLTFNTFFEDTSVFSESFGNNRGRTSLEDGSASNTEGFDSFTMSLEGHDMAWFPGLTYKLGLIHQGRGVDGVADENGVSASFLQSFGTAEGNQWKLIGELAAFENFQGTADNITYASAGIVYETGPWTAVLSGTWRPRDVADSSDFHDYSIQTSIEYDLGKGYSIA
ncbi:MAG: hypothetical protein AAFQ15_10240, partial [Pseudomonadota bacterium]